MPNLPPTHADRLDTLELHGSVTARVADSSVEALRQLTDGHKRRIVCHIVALIIELFGTAFVFLDALRLAARFPSDALFTVGDPLSYRHWCFHQAPLGFVLLLLGIVWQGYILWRENDAICRVCKTLAKSPR
jgi:hypothetical protein